MRKIDGWFIKELVEKSKPLLKVKVNTRHDWIPEGTEIFVFKIMKVYYMGMCVKPDGVYEVRANKIYCDKI